MTVQNTNQNINLPVDKENEFLILSNAIKSKDNASTFSRKINFMDFRMREHQALAWAIGEIVSKKLEMNIDALLLKVQSSPVRYNITYEFLNDLVTNYPEVPSSNFEEHMGKLKLDYIKSNLVDTMFKSLYKDCLDPASGLGQISDSLSVLRKTVERGYSTSKLDFKAMDVLISEYREMKNQVEGFRTCGFRQLDAKLSEGLKEGQISVIAGLSSAGKSSFALSMMKNLSNKRTITAQFALEMNSMSLVTKLLSFNSKMAVNRITKDYHNLSDEENRVLLYEMDRLAKNQHIYLNDKPSQGLDDIREQILILQDTLKTQYMVIVIDLYGKINELQGSDNFARDYEKNLNKMQILVRELGVHMCLVAQINRSVSHRKFNRPSMNDLKNSGALTEVADIIFGVHRPFYDPEVALKRELTYGSDSDDSEIEYDPNANLAEIIILKQRMGANNTLVNFLFDPDTTCFSPIDPEYQDMLNQTKFFEDDTD